MLHLGDMLSVDGDVDAAVETRIWIGWNKFRHWVPLLTNKDISVILYNSFVRSNVLHGSETWPIRKDNVVTLHQTQMRIVSYKIELQVKGLESD